MKRKIRHVVFALVLIALAVGYYFIRSTLVGHIESGFNLARVDWLPASASDISFVRRSGFGHLFVYEFHISDPDFQTLARDRNWQLSNTPQNCNVVRFTHFLPENDPRRREPFYITAETGYCYDNRTPGGAGIRALYDSSTSTAYIQKTSR